MPENKASKPSLEARIKALRDSFERRAIVVDIADGPCELCAIAQERTKAASDKAKRPVSTCFRCGSNDFTQGVHSDATKHMQSNGFRSVKPSHYHLWIGQSSASGKEA